MLGSLGVWLHAQSMRFLGTVSHALALSMPCLFTLVLFPMPFMLYALLLLQPTGLNIRFLTADVGELGNPQRKIVAAQAAYSLDTWQFTLDDVS